MRSLAILALLGSVIVAAAAEKVVGSASPPAPQEVPASADSLVTLTGDHNTRWQLVAEKKLPGVGFWPDGPECRVSAPAGRVVVEAITATEIKRYALNFGGSPPAPMPPEPVPPRPRRSAQDEARGGLRRERLHDEEGGRPRPGQRLYRRGRRGEAALNHDRRRTDRRDAGQRAGRHEGQAHRMPQGRRCGTGGDPQRPESPAHRREPCRDRGTVHAAAAAILETLGK
jgi:hypothetical protein